MHLGASCECMLRLHGLSSWLLQRARMLHVCVLDMVYSLVCRHDCTLPLCLAMAVSSAGTACQETEGLLAFVRRALARVPPGRVHVRACKLRLPLSLAHEMGGAA